MTITRSPAGTNQAIVASGPPAGDRDRRLVRRLLARTKDERGTAITELALVMPVLLLLLLGMIDFGKAINYWIDQTHLANEAARLAAVNNNPAGTGTTLQQYILNQTETAEQRGCQPTGTQGTQRSAHCAAVNICFYNSSGTLYTSPASAAVGDTVEVVVRYAYDWLRGFPFPGSPTTTITGKAAMRLEALPTNYDPANNIGGLSCPSSA
jgi:Flp pilus assembly protein TadG